MEVRFVPNESESLCSMSVNCDTHRILLSMSIESSKMRRLLLEGYVVFTFIWDDGTRKQSEVAQDMSN